MLPYILSYLTSQSVLSNVSKPTKLALSQVGIFSVASLHAIVSARHGSGNTGSNSLHLGRPKVGSPVSSVSVCQFACLSACRVKIYFFHSLYLQKGRQPRPRYTTHNVSLVTQYSIATQYTTVCHSVYHSIATQYTTVCHSVYHSLPFDEVYYIEIHFVYP